MSTRACDGSPAVKELLRHILAAFRYSTVPLTSGALGAAPALRRRERSNQRSLLTPRLSASLALKGARTGGSAKKSNQRAALDRQLWPIGWGCFFLFACRRKCGQKRVCSNKGTTLPAKGHYNAHRSTGGRGWGNRRGRAGKRRTGSHRAAENQAELEKVCLPKMWLHYSGFKRGKCDLRGMQSTL